ncbi:YqaA family protein [Cypionkella sp.]|uniref:YqaA family protein n=1 Tax=Cypionkella sp. TaxID=2811411 RepID=UPI002ABA07FA|nr:YqaA family protein [Cypionkella sp.]MDZ4392562.1 YqaA family protein [Cypionkella sp.]
MMTLSAMFFAAFIAATLIPAQSEAVLVGMILEESNPVWLLLLVATTGNVLGSLVNWAIGRFLQGYVDHRWFPASPGQVERARLWYARHGWWTLFGSWLPIIGDPLVLVSGLMREPFWRVVPVVTLAKAGRYIVLAWITLRFV